jgi:hypothetical protein
MDTIKISDTGSGFLIAGLERTLVQAALDETVAQGSSVLSPPSRTERFVGAAHARIALCRSILVAVFASVNLAAAGETISPDVRGRVGVLGFRWGASAQELEREGARHQPNSSFAGGEYYEMTQTPTAATKLLGERLAQGRFSLLVDARGGLHTAVLSFDKNFDSAADLWLHYLAIKERIRAVYGAPKRATEQNGTGNWTDKNFFDCLGLNFGANWVTSSDCRLEASWFTDTGILSLVSRGEDGQGDIMLIELTWVVPEQSP